MSSEILYRMRWLIIFIAMSLVAFGFTFFFLSDSTTLTPRDGIEHMLFMLLGNYEGSDVSSIYQSILFVVVAAFNFFFVLTLLIALSVVAFDNESKEDSNEAYQDRAAMIALYSYLLKEKSIRDPHKNYLLIATVTEHKKFSQFKESQLNDQKNQAKMMKNIERKFNMIQSRFDKQLKDVQDRLDALNEGQQKALAKSESHGRKP
mmetsp:Transcript_29530/g.28706  ORF Transcript_29530/g.28706 Transcript_29530/m.28706 type:complete len:205 (+) Transcript_29530:4331-4945(+)